MWSELPSNRVILMLAAVLLCSLSGPAQDLQGRFYPEKDGYMLGEPVLFNMEIKNTGKEVVYVNAKNPGKCLDSYELFVTGASSGCGANWDANCGDELLPLMPGDSYHGQWPLNFWYQFERAGTYQVTATRHIPVRSNRGAFQDFTFSSKFDVNLEAPEAERVQGILQEFERKLLSSDPDVRHAALDVLASTAPNYFQGIALRLSRDKDAFVVAHAVAALRRMNTPETRAAIADVIITGGATTDDEIAARIRAIEALGSSGDASYQGLIEHYIDDKNEYIQLAAMGAIAQLGKAEAVSQLQRYFFSADPVIRKNAAHALRFSLTPEAVEALINAVADKDANVQERVLTSLKDLTGHSVGDSVAGRASQEKIQNGWRSWWRANKANLVLPQNLEFVCHMK